MVGDIHTLRFHHMVDIDLVEEIGQELAADADIVAVADHIDREHRIDCSLVGPDIGVRLYIQI